MKKIIAIVLTVVLIAGGLGGFVYATNGHTPMTGQKLVGMGVFGPDPPDGFFDAVFTFTNPDGVSEITIEQISIISALGTVIYEGPYLDSYGKPYEDPMIPHAIRAIVLSNYITEPPAHAMGYTVEIFWTNSHKKGLTLMGIVYHMTETTADSSTEFGTTQMVNMEQELEPEDEEDED